MVVDHIEHSGVGDEVYTPGADDMESTAQDWVAALLLFKAMNVVLLLVAVAGKAMPFKEVVFGKETSMNPLGEFQSGRMSP